MLHRAGQQQLCKHTRGENDVKPPVLGSTSALSGSAQPSRPIQLAMGKRAADKGEASGAADKKGRKVRAGAEDDEDLAGTPSIKHDKEAAGGDDDPGTPGPSATETSLTARVKSHSDLLGRTDKVHNFMPPVNADLHAEIEQDLATILEHPVFHNIMTAQPLEIDAEAKETECGYKVPGIDNRDDCSSR